MRGASSLGLQLPMNLQVTDFTELRRENEDMDYLKFTRKMIEHFKQTHGDRFTTFVLDSLGAIYSLTTVDEAMRKKMFSFFDFLRSMNLNVLLITERNLEVMPNSKAMKVSWLMQSSIWAWIIGMESWSEPCKSRRCVMFVMQWKSRLSMLARMDWSSLGHYSIESRRRSMAPRLTFASDLINTIEAFAE